MITLGIKNNAVLMKEQIFMSLLEFVHKENLYSMCIRKKKAYYFFRGNSFSWH